jgi:hypothetical protein
MPTPTNNRVTLSRDMELERYIPVSQAAELKNVSEDTFRRRYGHLIEAVSDRRVAVQLRKLFAS